MTNATAPAVSPRDLRATFRATMADNARRIARNAAPGCQSHDSAFGYRLLAFAFSRIPAGSFSPYAERVACKRTARLLESHWRKAEAEYIATGSPDALRKMYRAHYAESAVRHALRCWQ
jgi:hypothetical protein